MSNFLFRSKSFAVPALLVLSLVLSSCAIESSKYKRKDIFDRDRAVEVDSYIQDDFDQALSLLKDSEYDQAIALLEKVIEQEKRLTAPYINLGIAYARKNELKNAENALIKAIELESANPIANNELGLVFRKTGRFNEAKMAYERALSTYPNYLPAIKNLGILCEIYMRDLECALIKFEEYRKYRPNDKTIDIWVSDLKRRLAK